MPVPFAAGAVVYAKSVAKVSDFYADVADLRITHAEQDYVVLESPTFQLVVVAIPAERAASMHIDVPPKRREARRPPSNLLCLSLASLPRACWRSHSVESSTRKNKSGSFRVRAFATGTTPKAMWCSFASM
ncbi:hypothetical protein HDE78_002623 [Rhodanobacter sp. K2T2]|uniref:hypothetical protein n=1 Tax=Rhodanobacter sp. K2T2 TaxID=2723085 RepID=UPI0015CA3BC6|nr:hypothetical protein [Rhodanobacter sp. K2T2]NYE29657.1 hypothetical protein [Rhodanobacter sp. K2T2]